MPKHSLPLQPAQQPVRDTYTGNKDSRQNSIVYSDHSFTDIRFH